MSNTNTNTNNGQNRNQISRRGGQGQRGPSGGGPSDCRNNHRNQTITNYLYEGKMKDSPIFKLLITKTGHRPTQFKNITDTLPILCANKNFRGLNEVLPTGHDLAETDSMLIYPNAT